MLLTALTLSALLLLRAHPPGRHKPRHRKSETVAPQELLKTPWHTHRYWGVTMMVPADGHACGPAIELSGRNFHLARAPKLPFEECSSEICHCHYVGLKNRRSERTHWRGSERRTDNAINWRSYGY